MRASPLGLALALLGGLGCEDATTGLTGARPDAGATPLPPPCLCPPLDDPCLEAVCDAAGACVSRPRAGATCDDGDPCTADDACDATGACRGTPAGDSARIYGGAPDEGRFGVSDLTRDGDRVYLAASRALADDRHDVWLAQVSELGDVEVERSLSTGPIDFAPGGLVSVSNRAVVFGHDGDRRQWVARVPVDPARAVTWADLGRRGWTNRAARASAGVFFGGKDTGGRSCGPGAPCDGFVGVLGPDDEVRWSDTIREARRDLETTDVAVGPDGSMWASGYHRSLDGQDYAVWVGRWVGEGERRAYRTLARFDGGATASGVAPIDARTAAVLAGMSPVGHRLYRVSLDGSVLDEVEVFEASGRQRIPRVAVADGRVYVLVPRPTAAGVLLVYEVYDRTLTFVDSGAVEIPYGLNLEIADVEVEARRGQPAVAVLVGHAYETRLGQRDRRVGALVRVALTGECPGELLCTASADGERGACPAPACGKPACHGVEGCVTLETPACP